VLYSTLHLYRVGYLINRLDTSRLRNEGYFIQQSLIRRQPNVGVCCVLYIVSLQRAQEVAGNSRIRPSTMVVKLTSYHAVQR